MSPATLPTLRYFGIRARADHIRLALALAGAKYVDERPTFDEWPSLKEKQPARQLPVWETPDGHLFPQSAAILQHVGRTYNLYGGSSNDALEIDALTHFVEFDIGSVIFKHFSTLDKPDSIKDIKQKVGPLLDLLVETIDGREWVAGTTQPSIADASFFHWIFNLVRVVDNELVDSRPALVAAGRRIAQIPRVTSYLTALAGGAPAAFAPLSVPVIGNPETCSYPNYLFEQ